MQEHDKKFWEEVAFDIIEKANPDLHCLLVFRNECRNQPWQESCEVSQIVELLDKLNLDI